MITFAYNRPPRLLALALCAILAATAYSTPRQDCNRIDSGQEVACTGDNLSLGTNQDVAEPTIAVGESHIFIVAQAEIHGEEVTDPSRVLTYALRSSDSASTGWSTEDQVPVYLSAPGNARYGDAVAAY